MSDSAPHSPPSPSPLIIDGRYRLLRLIGIGGMGAVYEAEHVAIGRHVAIKVLHSQFSQHADLVERLRREAQAASSIGHPNIVDVTDFGRTEDGSAYLAMEFLHGTDLGAILRERGRLAEARALSIGLQTVQALAAAHRAGVVHRDLKPENIFIVNPMDMIGKKAPLLSAPRSGSPPSGPGVYDLVKVLDFGIAVQIGSVPLVELPAAMPQIRRAGRLTHPGLTVGTPEYMAPEQAQGSDIDSRADIYAVGTLLYEMICGRVPFMAPSVAELLTLKTEQPAPAPQMFAPGINSALEALILRCLRRDPKDRPQTMESVEEALLELLIAGDPRVRSGEKTDRLAGVSHSGHSGMSLDKVAPVAGDGDVARGDVVGRVAVPTPSATTPPGAATLDASSSDTRKAPVQVSGSTGSHAAMAVLGAACLIAIGFVTARYVVRHAPVPPPLFVKTATPAPPPAPAPAPERASAPPAAVATPPPASRLPETPVTPIAPAVALPPAREEVKMLLEWARRAAAGRRYIAPPGDNLQELLARIEATSAGNVEARTLHDDATKTLSRRLRDELRRRRTLDALESFRALRALDPERHLDGQRRELLYQLLFVARIGRHGPGPKGEATLRAAHGAVEVAPTSAAAQLVFADALLAIAKNEAAATAYRRVLELHPRATERRLAVQGLYRLGKSVRQK